MDKKRWRHRPMGCGGVRRGRGGYATTSQGGQQEAVARQQAEAAGGVTRCGATSSQDG